MMKTLLTFSLLSFWLAMSHSGFAAVNLTNEGALAAQAYQQQNYAAALEAYDEILRIDTNNVQALIDRASCYHATKQYDKAFSDVNIAIEFATNNLDLGLAYSVRGFFDDETTNLNSALDDYSKSIEFNPAVPITYLNRAGAYLKLGLLAQAMWDCNMAVMLDPDSADAYDRRASVFKQMQKYDKCIADYTKAIELSTNNDVWYLYSRGLVFAAKEDWNPAILDFKKVLVLIPDNRTLTAEVLGAKGFALSKNGQYDLGIADCEKAIQSDTNCSSALNNLGWLLATAPNAKLRDGKRAVEYAKHACELTGWTQPYFLGTLAAAYAEVGNFDEAVKWERKCILIGLPDKDVRQAHIELDLFEQKQPYHAKN
jgi:tetratricopeptide (TPR) repeat protein